MAHENLIPSNLPLYFQCLRVACEVGTGVHPRFRNRRARQQILQSETHESSTLLYWQSNEEAEADTYDPWEKRRQFFQIKEGDDESLIEFLQSVGLFESPDLEDDSEGSTVLVIGPDGLYHTARYILEEEIATVWGTRRLIEGSLRNLNKHTGRLVDFTARITVVKDQPRVTITTCTFLESLLLTLAVDKVKKAKVRKCARPDCGALFSSVSAHGKKFCSWYCGHLESVRKQRRDAKGALKER